MKKESLKRKFKTPTAARRSPAKAPKNANESLLRTAWMAEAALALLLSVSAVIVAAVY
ncbi:MAG: hypothetical protein SOT16_00585 [Oscillospiraceae bacterium]|nr:hypothetical protein [Oscillospiraceae bacterium]